MYAKADLYPERQIWSRRSTCLYFVGSFSFLGFFVSFLGRSRLPIAVLLKWSFALSLFWSGRRDLNSRSYAHKADATTDKHKLSSFTTSSFDADLLYGCWPLSESFVVWIMSLPRNWISLDSGQGYGPVSYGTSRMISTPS